MGNVRFKFRIYDDTHKYYLPMSDAIIDGRTGKKFHGPIFSAEYTIEQCTGLRDKNGNLIYEGDIVCLCKGATLPITVMWDGIGWKFFRNGRKIDYAFESDIISQIQSCEIIGNIHQRKEKTE